MFGDCTALKTITLPEGLTSIGDNVFRDCTALTKVDIPETVKSFGDYVFMGCSKLKGIVIPFHCESLGKYFFGFSEKSDTAKYSGVTISCYKDTEGYDYAVDYGFKYKLLTPPVTKGRYKLRRQDRYQGRYEVHILRQKDHPAQKW